MNNTMIPVGYLAKRILSRPERFENKDIIDIYSVSGCISKDFANYIPFWRHNGYYLFDSPAIIRQVSREESIDLTGAQFFYYEMFHQEFHENAEWRFFNPEASFPTNVKVPDSKVLEGYDVVTFSMGNSPECSPLSCNYLSNEIPVNKHCLLNDFESAYQLLLQGKFKNSEPGPYRILAVYTV